MKLQLLIILLATLQLTTAKHIRSKKRSSSKKQEKNSQLIDEGNGSDDTFTPIGDSSLINQRSSNYIDEQPSVLPSPSPETHSAVPSESKIESMIDNYDFIMQRSFNYYATGTSSSPAPSSQVAISSIPSRDCKDNDSYQNPLGGHCGCSLFEATDCQKWDIFLSDIELAELMENCPVACGTCRYVFKQCICSLIASLVLK